MDVVIAGGHGQIARQLGALLAEDGNRVRGLIRNPDHAADLEALGVEPVVFDLEHDDGLIAAIGGADAAVFAADAIVNAIDPRRPALSLEVFARWTV